MPLVATIAIAVISGLLLLAGLAGCSRSTGAEEPGAPAAVQQPVTTEEMAGMSEDVLREMLANLRESPPPEPQTGAMCYSMAAPPSRIDHVCSTCGEKTLYVQSDELTMGDIWTMSSSLRDCRYAMKKLPETEGLTITLDELQFCSHCSEDIEKPELGLIVKYKDGRTHRVAPISDVDIRMLQAFLGGELDYNMGRDFTEALQKKIPRLEELLALGDEDRKTTEN